MDELRGDFKKRIVNSKIDCFFFDGKKDKSKVKLGLDGSTKVIIDVQEEEDISMCIEAGGE